MAYAPEGPQTQGARPARIVVIDDSQMMLKAIEAMLRPEGHDITFCERAEDALDLVEHEEIDLAISDVQMPGMNGFQFLERVREIDPNVEIVLITGNPSIEDAVASLHRGALFYIPKPFDSAELVGTVREILMSRRSWVRPTSEKFEKALAAIIGRSPALLDVLPLIQDFAESQTTVLVHGETGTGKELVARAIHDAGPRSEAPYIVCNCSAFSETLMESEFFGHAEGAYTDADQTHPGLFEKAHKGVLFLDEIGDLPAGLQAKLLRVLEKGEIQRVGETAARRFDVQVVAATNKQLSEEVSAGRFRKDLFFRLNVAQITLPPLRDRREDIPALVDKFLRDAAAEYGKPRPGMEPAAMDALQLYSWPGNVRDLRNAVFRIVLYHGAGNVTLDELPPEIARSEAPHPEPSSNSLDAMRREHIRYVLTRLDGNKSEAAKVLGVSRVTLYRELERYQLQA